LLFFLLDIRFFYRKTVSENRIFKIQGNRT